MNQLQINKLLILLMSYMTTRSGVKEQTPMNGTPTLKFLKKVIMSWLQNLTNKLLILTLLFKLLLLMAVKILVFNMVLEQKYFKMFLTMLFLILTIDILRMKQTQALVLTLILLLQMQNITSLLVCLLLPEKTVLVLLLIL